MARRARTLGSIAALALGASVLFAPSAYACSCIAISEEDVFRQSDAAVVVELRRVVEDPDSPTGEVKLIYDVRRVYKGPPSLERRDRLVLESQRASSCHVPEPRGPHGLYLHGRAGRWGASACSVTTPRAMRKAAEGDSARVSRGCR